jgi:hypothetical protein
MYVQGVKLMIHMVHPIKNSHKGFNYNAFFANFNVISYITIKRSLFSNSFYMLKLNFFEILQNVYTAELIWLNFFLLAKMVRV